MEYFIVARFSDHTIEIKYLEYDYHAGQSYPTYLTVEREYISINKDYGKDVEHRIRHDAGNYLLQSNMDIDFLNIGIPMVSACPEIIHTIIADHLTVTRVSKWASRALGAKCRTMRDFNRYLLNYLYDRKLKEGA